MNRIVISEELNPYYNLALEEELLNNVLENENILYLWQNENTVVVGRNQNPYLECDIDYINKNNINLVRRISGGGTVFHDINNLNFTFITKSCNANLEKQLSVIKLAVEKFGLNVEFSGRNDLLIQGKKFSGNAFYDDGENYFHHGTIMINVNTDILQKTLKPSKLKLQSKGITSVKSRIINLSSLSNEINVSILKSSLENAFKKVYGNIVKKDIYNESYKKCSLYEKYKSREWNFGESPNYNVMLEEKFDFGNIQILLSIKNNKIYNAEIYSDTLENIDFNQIKNVLLGKDFSEKCILEYIKQNIN